NDPSIHWLKDFLIRNKKTNQDGEREKDGAKSSEKGIDQQRSYSETIANLERRRKWLRRGNTT
ncbi:unnamed protein product, partial [Rotaria magnacalcarata]